MTDIISDEPAVDAVDNEVGLTSDETGKKSLLESITIYDTMLVLSFIFVTMAAFRLFFAIRTYSDGFPFVGGYPWRTGEFLNVLLG